MRAIPERYLADCADAQAQGPSNAELLRALRALRGNIAECNARLRRARAVNQGDLTDD